MHSVYLLTGSNLGDRLEQLKKAVQELEQRAGTIAALSPVFETEAWGKEGLPSHLNQAIHLKTLFAPPELLKVIHSIEEDLGRVRQEKWGVRMIDIDIIYFDDLILSSPTLQVPHPLMQMRNFVLQPLCEIAPDFIHPLLLKTNSELLRLSKDHLAANLFV